MYCPNPECPDFKQTGEPGEYVEGVRICPYCKSRLVVDKPKISEPPDEEEPDGEYHEAVAENADLEPGQGGDYAGTIDDPGGDLVAVASYNYPLDATLAKTFLLNHGIYAKEFPDDHGGLQKIAGFGEGIHLLVPQSQAERATALLEKAEKEPSRGYEEDR